MSYNLLKALAISTSALFSLSSLATTYIVEELHPETHTSSFGSAISESGELLINATGKIRPELDLTILDLDNEAIASLFENPSEVRDADSSDEISDDDYLVASALIAEIQGITYTDLYIDDEQVHVFDVTNENTGNLTGTTTEEVFNILDKWFAGYSDAPLVTVEYELENGDEVDFRYREFNSRAFININDRIIELLAPEDTLGGYSRAYDINDNGLVVGTASTEISEAALEAEELCEDQDTRGDFPEEYCKSIINRGYTITGYSWQVDSRGDVIDGAGTEWPLLIEPEERHRDRFISTPIAINNNDVAVGYATDYYQNERQSFAISRYATIFDDEQVISFTDNDTYLESVATDINDDNIVVGYVRQLINGFTRNKFFVYDIESEELTFPDDFFPGSSSKAKAINNEGLVVGDGEVDDDLNTIRRRHAFIYSMADNSFSNLNDLVECSNQYTIVEANGINDEGEIAATALITKELLDINGAVVTNNDGSVVEREQPVAVKLIPQPGDFSGCNEPNEVITRSGASAVWLSVIALLMLAVRKHKLRK